MCLYAACTCKLPRTRRARATHMPRTVRQVSDLHCNCSFRNLFGSPLPFAVLEEELPIGNLTAEHFQVAITSIAIVRSSSLRYTAYSYMQP